MPPKFYQKSKRKLYIIQGNYSYNNYNDKDKTNYKAVKFLLIGINKVGIDVPYKLLNNDQELKNIIKVTACDSYRILMGNG